MKKIGFGLGAALCVCGGILAVCSAPRAAADAPTTQSFAPSARFALMAGVVSTATQDESGQAVQQAVFRVDTRTGQTWVYQGKIRNLAKPEIVAADWVPVREPAPEQRRRQERPF